MDVMDGGKWLKKMIGDRPSVCLTDRICDIYYPDQIDKGAGYDQGLTIINHNELLIHDSQKYL